MPDGGFASSYLPALSRLLGEVEQPTNTQQMMAPQFGGSPEQLMAFLQSPHMQQQMQQFGVHFDPSQVRQSPFFPNQFMQHHPGLGGFLNRGLAGMAATPEAPMVSGFGSGLSRFAQGAAGGPEMLRQYQVRQMMAPFQAMGAQIPGMEFQRKQQLLQLLEKMEEDRMRQAQSMEQAPRFKPVPGGTEATQYQQGRPEGGAQGVDFQATGQGQPIQSMSGYGQPIQMPGYGLTPEQQAGWYTQFIPEQGAKVDLQRAQAGLAQAGGELKGEQKKTEKAKQKELSARGDKERAQGAAATAKTAEGKQKPADLARYSKQYNDVEKQFSTTQKQLDSALAAKQIDQKTYDRMLAEAVAARETSKSNIDKARGDPGASGRGLVSPGAGGPPPAPGGPNAQQTKPAYRIGSQWFDATTHQPIQAPQQQ